MAASSLKVLKDWLSQIHNGFLAFEITTPVSQPGTCYSIPVYILCKGYKKLMSQLHIQT